VNLLTMPTVTDPANPNRLLPAEPADDVIFQMILDGQPWQHKLPTQPYHQVKVRVLNGTGTAGQAGQAASQLRKLGFDVIGTGNAAPASTTTVTYSGTAQADSAYTLMTALKTTPAAQNLLQEPAPQTGTPGPVTLVVGTDFAGVNPPPAAHHGTNGSQATTGQGSQPSPATIQTRNAAASICSGLPTANPNPGHP
jgi:hypothetical protein